ncbi:hypothetical protein G6F63_015143 [Rhizopus arrhizus]|nr:hypothetical protein G6F63_015143 [Rhizopus arrhizus]
MQVAAAALDNRSGSIEQAGDGLLQIDATTLQGHGGRIVSNGELQLGEAGQLDNTGGTLNATGHQTMALQVRGALDTLMRHRPTLVIAHRLSTIRDADLILYGADAARDPLGEGGFQALSRPDPTAWRST